MTAPAPLDPLPWDALYQARRRVRARWRRVWALPCCSDARCLIARHGGPRDAGLLDVGAGDRRWQMLAARFGYDPAGYRSVDPAGAGHDFAALDQVDGRFGTVLLFETLEHLPLAEGWALLVALRARLAAGGVLLVTTPNGHHATRGREDPTHRTMFTYESLGAVLLLAGYELHGLFRLMGARRRAAAALLAPLVRALGLDLAPGLAAAAVAPPFPASR